MKPGESRIHGWKSIAAHLGRDRTTAMRWAKERGLPVHAMPGGGTRSVYAYASELDAWAKSREAAPETIDTRPRDLVIDPPSGAPSSTTGLGRGEHRGRGYAAGLVIAALVVVAAGAFTWTRLDRKPSRILPRDPESARLYVEARDRWAGRDRASIDRSIADLETVTAREPDFAGGWSALADAYLLSGEFGEVTKARAAARARPAAERGLALDPRSAAARRALAFIAYWRDHDRARAGRLFREAIRLEPTDAQTHFWYANALADNGEFAAAFREFDRARLSAPGSLPIRTDLAWARWQAGWTHEAEAELQAVADQAPDYEEPVDCLGMIRLGEGDLDGYLALIDRRARLRGVPELGRWVRDLDASRIAGPDALKATILRLYGARPPSTSPLADRPAAAFVASAIGDRSDLLAVLRIADAAHERWGDAGYLHRIAQRWRDDAEVMALVARRRPPRMEDPTA